MKKVLLLMLICAMALCGCTSKGDVETEPQEIEYEEFEVHKFEQDVLEDSDAIQDYEGNYYEINGRVESANDEYTVLAILGSSTTVNVYFNEEPDDDIEKGDQINVIGKLSSIEVQEIGVASLIVELKDAEYIDNITVIERTGRIYSIYDSFFDVNWSEEWVAGEGYTVVNGERLECIYPSYHQYFAFGWFPEGTELKGGVNNKVDSSDEQDHIKAAFESAIKSQLESEYGKMLDYFWVDGVRYEGFDKVKVKYKITGQEFEIKSIQKID